MRSVAILASRTGMASPWIPPITCIAIINGDQSVHLSGENSIFSVQPPLPETRPRVYSAMPTAGWGSRRN